jgi:hypothetical protein
MGLLGAIAVVAVGAAGAYAVSSFLDGGGPSGNPAVTTATDGASPVGDNVASVPNVLLTANRDRLALCVQSLDGMGQPIMLQKDGAAPVSTSAPDPVDAIKRAVAKLPEHPNWSQAELASYPAPVVTEGCASPPVLFHPSSDAGGLSAFGLTYGRLTTTPGYEKVMIFVAPPEALHAIGAESGTEVAEEFMCSGDNCFSVTRGLYLEPTTLTDLDVLSSLVAQAVGIE